MFGACKPRKNGNQIEFSYLRKKEDDDDSYDGEIKSYKGMKDKISYSMLA